MNHSQVLATEWRLGRVDRNIGYYKMTMRNHMMLQDYKASRDWWLIQRQRRNNIPNFPSTLDSSVGDTNPLIDPNFNILAREVYEETSGKKVDD